MHPIHHTEGFIFSGTDMKEADRFLVLFTRDLGLVRAMAGGVRKLASKLRFVLQDLSHAHIDLVSGRELWRLTSASKSDVPPLPKDDSRAFLAIARLARTIMRLCPGEEPNISLYDTFLESYLFIAHEAPALSDAEMRDAELLAVWKIVRVLGYGGETPAARALEGVSFSHDALKKAGSLRTALLADVNRAYEASHL